MAIFTTSTLNEIVNIAMEKIKERKVFNANIRNEMTVFRFELEEGSQEFSVLKTAYESLLKKGDAEKFYSNFYGDIAVIRNPSCVCHNTNILALAFRVKLPALRSVLSFHFLRYSKNSVSHWNLQLRLG